MLCLLVSGGSNHHAVHQCSINPHKHHVWSWLPTCILRKTVCRCRCSQCRTNLNPVGAVHLAADTSAVHHPAQLKLSHRVYCLLLHLYLTAATATATAIGPCMGCSMLAATACRTCRTHRCPLNHMSS
jgi:hypothetical protein